jgi:hypothetical protein
MPEQARKMEGADMRAPGEREDRNILIEVRVDELHDAPELIRIQLGARRRNLRSGNALGRQ